MSSGKPYSGNMEEMAVKIMSFGNRFFEHFLLPKEKEESCSVMLDVTVPPLFPERAIPGGVLDGVLRDRTVTTQTILSCNQAKSFPDALHSATFQLASCVDGRTTDFVWNIAFFLPRQGLQTILSHVCKRCCCLCCSYRYKSKVKLPVSILKGTQDM